MANATLLGTEVLQVLAIAANGSPAATTQTCTTQQIANLAGSTGISQIVLDGATSGTTTVVPQAIASGTLSLPAATDTLTGKATTDVFTNKTLDTAGAGNVFKINGTQVSAVTGTGSAVLATTPTLVTPVLGVATATSLNGLTVTTSTGTLTVPNGVVLTGPASSGTAATLAGTETLTNKTLTGAINTNIVRSSAQKDSTSATLASITGLTQTVVPGTYKFRAVLPGLADGTGGVKYAFKLTTTVLTSIEATGLGYTSSAVAVQHTTTTTDQTLLFDQAAAVICTIIEGTTVIGTGGTIDLQTAQHTNSGTSSTYVGASLDFTRIA